jgi:hypothetical protein
MTTKEGWITFIVAVAAGITVYLLDQALPVGAGKSSGLATVQSPSGQALPVSPQATATDLSILQSSMADVDAGTPPTPQVQTEAAYNATAANGSGSNLATGDTTMDSDYDSYEDPSEVYS